MTDCDLSPSLPLSPADLEALLRAHGVNDRGVPFVHRIRSGPPAFSTRHRKTPLSIAFPNLRCGLRAFRSPHLPRYTMRSDATGKARMRLPRA